MPTLEVEGMTVYLPVMPVEMTWEVGDRNYSLNALPRMILLMTRDGHNQENIEQVTGLSAQAVAQERQLLVEQGLMQANGALSDVAKAVLDIYEFEDGHKDEKYLYYRDMHRNLLLPQYTVEAVQNVPDDAAWVDWPNHYDETGDLHNAFVAKKKVFAGYEHLLGYYDIDFPLSGSYSGRKWFVPLKQDGQIQHVTKAEISADKAAKMAAGEASVVSSGLDKEVEVDESKLNEIDEEHRSIILDFRVAISGWHLCVNWQTEDGQKNNRDICLLPWGEIIEYNDVVEADDNIPQLHLPSGLTDQLTVISTFVMYLYNNDWKKTGTMEKLIDLRIQQVDKIMVLYRLALEDKPL